MGAPFISYIRRRAPHRSDTSTFEKIFDFFKRAKSPSTKAAFARMALREFSYTGYSYQKALLELLKWQRDNRIYYPFQFVIRYWVQGSQRVPADDLSELLDLVGQGISIRLLDVFQAHRGFEFSPSMARSLKDLYKANPRKRGLLPVFLASLMEADARAFSELQELPVSLMMPETDDKPVIAFSAWAMALLTGRIATNDIERGTKALIDVEVEETWEEGTISDTARNAIDIGLRRRGYDEVSSKALASVISHLMGERRAEPLIGILRSALDARHTALEREACWSDLGLPVSLFEMLPQRPSQSSSLLAAANSLSN